MFSYLDAGEPERAVWSVPIVVFSTLAAAAQSPASRYGMTEGGEQRCRGGVGGVVYVEFQVEQGGFSQRVLVCRQGSASVKGEHDLRLVSQRGGVRLLAARFFILVAAGAGSPWYFCWFSF